MKIFSSLVTLFLVMSMVVLVTNVVYSQDESKKDVKTLSGVVIAVDVENNSLTVEEDKTKTTVNFLIDTKTVIRKGDKTITLADIFVKNFVEVKFVKAIEVKLITVR